MLDLVILNVIQRRSVIGFVSQHMFPIAALPNAAFPPVYPNRRASLDVRQGLEKAAFIGIRRVA
jgi:hypothetical protein